MPSQPALSRGNAGHNLPTANGYLSHQHIVTTVNAHQGGLSSPLENCFKQAVTPAEFGLITRHSKSVPAISYFRNEYSRVRGVKQVTFITIFMRLVVLFFDKYLCMGQGGEGG